MTYKTKKALALALAFGLVVPNAYAAENEESTELTTSTEITETTVTTETTENSEEETSLTNADDESAVILEDDTEDTEDLADKDEKLADKEEEPSEEKLSAAHAPKTFKVNGLEKEIRNILIKDASGQAKAYVIGLKDLANAVASSDLNFDIVSIDGLNVTLTTGLDYAGGQNVIPADDELALANIEQVEANVTIDGESQKVEAYLINGELFFRGSQISNALGYRFRSNFENSSEMLFDKAASDIAVPTIDEINAQIAKAEYSIIYNWGPWCPYSRASLPHMEDLASVIKASGKDIQVLSFIDRSSDYSKAELEGLYKNSVRNWVEFGTSNEINKQLNSLHQADITGVPTVFIVDRNGKKVGQDLSHYYGQYEDLLKEKANLDNEAFDEKYYNDDNWLDTYKEIFAIVAHDYLSYEFEGEKVKLADEKAEVDDDLVVKEDDENDEAVDKEEEEKVDVKKEEKKEETKVDKKEEKKETKGFDPASKNKSATNPSTGVTGLTSIALLAGASALILHKTKRD